MQKATLNFIDAMRETGTMPGWAPLTADEQSYANMLVDQLHGPDAYPVVSDKDWEDLNRAEAEKLAQEELDAHLAQNMRDLAKGYIGAEDVSKDAYEYAILKGNVLGRTFNSAAALSAARQLDAEALVNNPELEPSLEASQYSDKEAILENHINMWRQNYNNSSFILDKLPGWAQENIPGAEFLDVTQWFEGLDKYSGKNLAKALEIGDYAWFDKEENLEHLYNVYMTVLEDPRISPALADKIYSYMDKKLIDAGVNPYYVDTLYQYLQHHDRGLKNAWQWIDYGTAVGMIAGKGIKGAVEGYKAVGAFKGTTAGAKAAGAAIEGTKGIVVGAIEEVPLMGVSGVSKGAKKLIKGSTDNFGTIGRLLHAGDYKRAKTALEELIKEEGEITSAVGKSDFYDRVENSVNKPINYNKDDTLVANKGIQSEKAAKNLIGRLVSTIDRFFNVNNIKSELWSKEALKIARALEDTGAIKDILPTQKGFRDFEAFVEPLLEDSGNITARVKLDMIDELKKKMYPAKSGDKAKIWAEATAEEMTTSLNESLKGYNIKVTPYLEGNQWKLRADIGTNKGWATLYNEMRPLKKGTESWRPFLSGLFTVTSDPSDIRILNQARDNAAGLLKSTSEGLRKMYNGLNSVEQNMVDQLTRISTHYQAFYTPEQLLSRGVSQKVVDVYTNWRALNDLDYFVRNKGIKDMLVSMGIKDLNFNGKYIGRGRVVSVLDEASFKSKVKGFTYAVIDSANADDVIKVSDITDAKLADMYNKGYRIVEHVHQPENFHTSSKVIRLYDGKSLVENDLGEFVTSYVAGGRRYFDRRGAFVKQMVKEGNFIKGVQTFGADLDTVGLQGRVKTIESIRRAVAEGNLGLANKLIADSSLPREKFANAEEFIEWATGIGIDTKDPLNALEVVKDGVPLNAYAELKRAGAVDLMEESAQETMFHRSAFQAMSTEAKMAKLRRTGKELFAWDLDPATTVDFEEQLRYMTNDMVYTGVMPFFTQFYAEKFAKNFAPVIDQSRGPMSAIDMLLNGTVRKGLTGAQADLAKAAETAQKNYKAVRGIPSWFDEHVLSVFNDAVIGAIDKSQKWFKISDDAAHGARIKWAEWTGLDPLNFARSFTSQWNLALLNPSQLYKQWASDFAVWALDPRAAAQASKYHLPFTIALYKADGNVNKAIDILAKSFGDSPKEVQQSFKNLIKMGAFAHGTMGGAIDAGRSVSSLFNKISYAPFNVGEMANRTKAYLAALYSKGFWGKEMTDLEAAEVAAYAQSLFIHMDATGLSRAQASSFGKTALQYQGYRMRWFETVMFDRELTGAQKKRLGIANALLVGGEGMLGVGTWNYMSSLFNDYSEPRLDEPEVLHDIKTMVSQGFLNYAMEKADLDINLGSVLDLSYGDFIDEFLLEGKWDIPVASMVSKVLQGVSDSARELNRMFFDEYTAEDFSNFLQIMARKGELPPSISKPYLATLMWKTGMEFNGRGQLTKEDNTKLEAVLKGLGFSSKSIADVYRARLQESHFKKDISDFKKQFQPAYYQNLRNPSPGLQKTLEFMLKKSGFNDTIKRQVIKETLNNGPATAREQIKDIVRRQFNNLGLGGNQEYIKAKYEGEQ